MAYDIYPYTNLHNLNLDWILDEMKRVAAESASTAEAQAALKEYVDNWTEEQDVPAQVQEEVEAEIDRLITSGELAELIGGQIPALTSNRKGRRWLFIGDSYANRTDDWDDTIVSDWGLTRADLTAGDSYDDDTDCFTIRAGGYGFVGVTTSVGSGGPWLDLCTSNWPADVDKDTITDIVIVGGYNDRGPLENGAANAAQIYNAMRAFATGFTDSFVNATVWIAEAGMHSRNVLDRQRLEIAYKAYSRAAEVGPNWHYIKGSEGVLHSLSALNDTDFHHPTSLGGIRLGRYIEYALQHIEPPMPVVFGTLAAATGVTFPHESAYFSWYDPDSLTAHMRFIGLCDVTFSSPLAANAVQAIATRASVADSYIVASQFAATFLEPSATVLGRFGASSDLPAMTLPATAQLYPDNAVSGDYNFSIKLLELPATGLTATGVNLSAIDISQYIFN